MNLVVSRIIDASAERLFKAWTEPEQLRQWWGPESVICIEAEVDLRVGGRYQLGNQFADGTVVWISGKFKVVEAPHTLAYTWRIGTDPAEELVTVSFRATNDEQTEVTVVHERIPDKGTRDRHEQGWFGCLEKLSSFLTRAAPSGSHGESSA
jgi:uncharacterized protein YndB with AHSA1/START domain